GRAAASRGWRLGHVANGVLGDSLRRRIPFIFLAATRQHERAQVLYFLKAGLAVEEVFGEVVAFAAAALTVDEAFQELRARAGHWWHGFTPGRAARSLFSRRPRSRKCSVAAPLPPWNLRGRRSMKTHCVVVGCY